MTKDYKTLAETYLQILAYLLSSGKSWNHLDEIIRDSKIPSQNPGRLKDYLDDLVRGKIILIWDLERKNYSVDEIKKIESEYDIHGINYYKITDLGIMKFEKIRDSCLDEHTQIILKIRDNLDR